MSSITPPKRSASSFLDLPYALLAAGGFAAGIVFASVVMMAAGLICG